MPGGLRPLQRINQMVAARLIMAPTPRVDVRAGILHWEPQSLALLKMPEEDRRAIAIECWELAADAGVPEARDCLKQARDVWDVKYTD